MPNDILYPDHIHWQYFTDHILCQSVTILQNLNLYRIIRCFHRTYVWHAYSGCILLLTSGSVPYGIVICYTCWYQSFSRFWSYFPDYALGDWDLIKNYEVSLSQMLLDILGHDHVQWHPQLIRHYTNLRTYYRTGLYYRFWPYYQIFEVSIELCNGCG